MGGYVADLDVAGRICRETLQGEMMQNETTQGEFLQRELSQGSLHKGDNCSARHCRFICCREYIWGDATELVITGREVAE